MTTQSVPQEIVDLVGDALTPKALAELWRTNQVMLENRRPMDIWGYGPQAQEQIRQFILSASTWHDC